MSAIEEIIHDALVDQGLIAGLGDAARLVEALVRAGYAIVGRAAMLAQLDEHRAQAIEEAARVADKYAENPMGCVDNASAIAQVIRALADPPSQFVGGYVSREDFTKMRADLGHDEPREGDER